jgi:exodeoxyribonuclease-5
MHAAKGLEWPVVIPINTMTSVMPAKGEVIDRDTGALYCAVLGKKPTGYETVRNAETQELQHERVRLWYVAATRARELLVLPRLDVAPPSKSWIALVELLDGLPSFDASKLPENAIGEAEAVANAQTRESFAAEAASIVGRQKRLKWLAPSRDESSSGLVIAEEAPAVWTSGEEGQISPPSISPAVQGGRERGLLLHKLMEEVLTGELADDAESLESRAYELIQALGRNPTDDASVGLSAQESADCVTRTLAIAEVAELRPRLLAEFPVHSLTGDDNTLFATAGIADAIAIDAGGRPDVVIDWKSDVSPDAETMDHYRAQVRAYLDVTGSRRGLIVLMTTGTVVTVSPSPQPIAA